VEKVANAVIDRQHQDKRRKKGKRRGKKTESTLPIIGRDSFFPFFSQDLSRGYPCAEEKGERREKKKEREGKRKSSRNWRSL